MSNQLISRRGLIYLSIYLANHEHEPYGTRKKSCYRSESNKCETKKTKIKRKEYKYITKVKKTRKYTGCLRKAWHALSCGKISRKKRITFFRSRFLFREKRAWRSVRCTCTDSKFRAIRLLFLLVLIFINMDNVSICFLSLPLSYVHSVHIWNGFINKDNEFTI